MMREKILASLKKSKPLPIYQVAERTGICVSTASKYCHILQAEGKIKMVKFGNMKLVELR
jgi:ribosomal protein S25